MSIDFGRLRRQIQIEDLLSWMSWKPTQNRGPQLRGHCPLCQRADDEFLTASHRSHSRSFSVNTRRNIFRCFRCHRSGNALELWALYRGLDIYSAASEIQNRLAVSNQTRYQATHQRVPANQPPSNRSASHSAKLAQFLIAIENPPCRLLVQQRVAKFVRDSRHVHQPRVWGAEQCRGVTKTRGVWGAERCRGLSKRVRPPNKNRELISTGRFVILGGDNAESWGATTLKPLPTRSAPQTPRVAYWCNNAQQNLFTIQ